MNLDAQVRIEQKSKQLPNFCNILLRYQNDSFLIKTLNGFTLIAYLQNIFPNLMLVSNDIIPKSFFFEII